MLAEANARAAKTIPEELERINNNQSAELTSETIAKLTELLGGQ